VITFLIINTESSANNDRLRGRSDLRRISKRGDDIPTSSAPGDVQVAATPKDFAHIRSSGLGPGFRLPKTHDKYSWNTALHNIIALVSPSNVKTEDIRNLEMARS